MATVTVVKNLLTAADLGGPRKVGIWTWGPLTNTDDVGEAVTAPMFPDRTVQVFGTFGTATCVIEGTLDGVNWATLTDQSDNFIALTTAKIEAIAPVTLQVRPKLTNADGTTSLTVILLAKGAKF